MSQAEHVREFRFFASESFPTGGHISLYQLELGLEDITALPAWPVPAGRATVYSAVFQTGSVSPAGIPAPLSGAR